MKNEYRKNHYIPEFYLKNFTDENNHFFIYDKKSKWSEKVSYRSPSNICFEWDRNTMFFDNRQSYKGLEKETYGYFDNLHAKTFELLNNSAFDQFPWNLRTVGDLEFFVPLTFWRSPASDLEFKDSLRRESFIDEIRLKMKDPKDEIVDWTDDFKSKFLDGLNIKKALRPIIAYSSFGKPNKVNDSLEWRIIYKDEDKGKKNLTSDNPIIFREKPQSFEDFRSAIILPATRYKTLIRINKKTDFDCCHESFLQDIMIFHQATRYVISSNKDYLIDIAKECKVFEGLGIINNVRNWLFEKYK